MFTGIITHLGTFKGFRRGREEMVVEAPGLAGKITPGESLAVNGACLSLVREERAGLVFNVSQETAARTTFGRLRAGDRLNLESPLSLSAPLSGHLVTGHVDGIGKVMRITERRPGRRLTVSFPAELRPYLVPKGSVAVDGVSLTVAALGPTTMDLELIPLTLGSTNLGLLKAGAAVNLECDILGKYVYNYLSGKRASRL
jgi:riboflavin synthase